MIIFLPFPRAVSYRLPHSHCRRCPTWERIGWTRVILLSQWAGKVISPRGCGRHQQLSHKSLSGSIPWHCSLVLAPDSFHRFFPLDFITNASISALPSSRYILTILTILVPFPYPLPPKPLDYCTSFTSSCHIFRRNLFFGDPVVHLSCRLQLSRT